MVPTALNGSSVITPKDRRKFDKIKVNSINFTTFVPIEEPNAPYHASAEDSGFR